MSNLVSNSSFYAENKMIGVKGKLFNDRHSVEAGFGTPEGSYHFEYIEGDNTQGPFQLGNIPVLSMTESIYIIEDGVKRALSNGMDYTIDYRTGRINLTFILEDDDMLEVEYYSSSWSQLSRVDYVLGTNSNMGMFNIGLNGGGVYFKEDSINSDSNNSYLSAGLNAGFKYKEIINISSQVMTSADKTDSGYVYKGTGLSVNGNASYNIVSLTGNIYKSFNEFQRVGEISDKEYTTLGLSGTVTPAEWVNMKGDYSKQLSTNTDSRTMSGSGQVKRDKLGTLDYIYSDNYNYSYSSNKTKYIGHSMGYSNTLGLFNLYMKGNTGISQSIQDTVITEYRKNVIDGGLSAQFNKSFNVSLNIGGENRVYEDSIDNVYKIGGLGYYKYKDIVDYSITGNYMRKNNMNLYSGINSIKLNISKYLNISSKVKADVNRRHSYSDSTEPEIKYSISNQVSSTPLSFMRVRYNNTMLLSQGIMSSFIYQRNISNSGNVNILTKYAQMNVEAGNGLFLNYSNTLPNELQSDNRRYYINSSINPIEINGYKSRIYGTYTTNNGLTMQYVQVSYSDEIDTVSNLISQKDYAIGADINRNFEFGKMTAGYSFVRNSKYMPDSIPIDAYSNKAYIEGKRNIFKGLDVTIKAMGEWRKGIDPDIERTDEYMDVIIITPEMGVFYAVSLLGSAGIIYNTSLYTGSSEQIRHNVGLNLNIRKGYFDIKASGNYAVSDYYKTLEYNINVGMRF